MIIRRIKISNYKTYLSLDLDLSVDEERPIILIGGRNGGGKTTLFEAIYGALYGLHIRNKREFEELLNDGGRSTMPAKIELELTFEGRVLSQTMTYILKRTYKLNEQGKPMESVSLNMNGSTFVYGPATPARQRAESEQQVNKIIKANLPEELSQYFLFDAMQAGNMIKDDVFSRIIKDNIQNVMGFNKYLQLRKVAENIQQDYAAQRMKEEEKRKEYESLCQKRAKAIEEKTSIEQKLEQLSSYIVANKDNYDRAKSGAATMDETQKKIEEIDRDIRALAKDAEEYGKSVNEYLKSIEQNVFFPHAAQDLEPLLEDVLRKKDAIRRSVGGELNEENIRRVTDMVVDYLKESSLCTNDVEAQQVAEFIIKKNAVKDEYAYLDNDDVTAIRRLLGMNEYNNYAQLQAQRRSLNERIENLPQLKDKKRTLQQSQMKGNFKPLIMQYENNLQMIDDCKKKKEELETAIKELDAQIHKFDVQVQQIPDVKYDTLAKLPPFFKDVADDLLRRKRFHIQEEMKRELNMMLPSYQDNIDRVELSDSLDDFTIKLYHKAGNEISLSHLNAASKQIFIQVLLKVLRNLGDYDPPVMIDTVMGVLDEESREVLMENYFPKLSDQVILLCTTSEIRPEVDYKKLEAYLSKTYTLSRDAARQKTDVSEGYFNKMLNEKTTEA